jgi:hypothetical protein
MNSKSGKRVRTGFLIAAIFCLFFVALAVTAIIIGISLTKNKRIGFSFTNKTPEFVMGDLGAGRHLFIHKYPIPKNGQVIGFEYLNDYENGDPEQQEKIILLLLRPENNYWSIFYRYDTVDDDPVSTDGVTRILFPHPIEVQKGDIFATYQSIDSPTGGIPLNSDKQCIEGKSPGGYGFDEEQLQVDMKIQNQGFGGCRDYFIHLLFQAD